MIHATSMDAVILQNYSGNNFAFVQKHNCWGINEFCFVILPIEAILELPFSSIAQCFNRSGSFERI